MTAEPRTTPPAALSDRRRLYATAVLRGVGAAVTGVAIAAYLEKSGYHASVVGYVTSAGLAGAAVASLYATLRADRIGRRRFLVVMSIARVVGGALALVPLSLPLLVAAAFVGMWNGMGRARGAGSLLEAAMLPTTATDEMRTRAFARYTALQDVGNALGFLLLTVLLAAPLPTDVSKSPVETLRWVLGIYPLTMVGVAWLYGSLSSRVEVASRRARSRVSPQARGRIVRLSALFALDSVGGGFVSASLVSYFFFERFHVATGVVAAMFFAARVLNAVSHLVAAWLAKRIGLVNTMVFTHIPSSVLLATVAIAPSFSVAAVLFLLRESLAEMDVPTRQSYVMAVVAPEERTAASGATSLVRLLGWAVGAFLAGELMENVSLAEPLVVAAVLKIAYDLALWMAFRKVRPPEEKGQSR